MAWQKAMYLAKMVYGIQKQLPKEEVYGLGDQIRRAVVSIPSNIAEGFGRKSQSEFKHFLAIARGSLTASPVHYALRTNHSALAANCPVAVGGGI